jgi:hypothetical protein
MAETTDAGSWGPTVRLPVRPDRHWVLLGDAARGSKGRDAQCIKPSVTLDLLAVEVELFAAADPAVAQGPLVKRRRSIAVLQASTPIANGRQGPLEEARAPRPIRNPAPTAVPGLRLDYLHISTRNARDSAQGSTSSCAGNVQCGLMLQTRVSQPCLRDFHAVNGYLLPPGSCGAQTGVLPDDGDDRDIDLRKNVCRHRTERGDAEKQDQQGQHVKV